MIDVQTAFKKAKEYFTNLYDSNEEVTVYNVLIEEVTQETISGIPDCWVITLGFNILKKKLKEEDSYLSDVLGLYNQQLKDRKFKTIILPPDGDFIAMKIRGVEYA